MDTLIIREAESKDAPALAEAFLEWGRHYADMDPSEFQVPEGDGLAGWFEEQVHEELGEDDSLWLVAERGNQLIGYIKAQVWRPWDGSGRQIVREASQTVLKIDAMMVRGTNQRSGVGTALMEAAESWGRGRGATQAIVISYAHSPTSVPFYEERMGYRRKTIGFGKPL